MITVDICTYISNSDPFTISLGRALWRPSDKNAKFEKGSDQLIIGEGVGLKRISIALSFSKNNIEILLRKNNIIDWQNPFPPLIIT